MGSHCQAIKLDRDTYPQESLSVHQSYCDEKGLNRSQAACYVTACCVVHDPERVHEESPCCNAEGSGFLKEQVDETA